jgi:segregation and condensation protein B
MEMGDIPLSLDALIESLLFISGEPVKLARLASVLGVEVTEVEIALAYLAARCQAGGLRLQRQGELVQLVTAPEAAPYVERFLGLVPDGKLSAAALETLALIAYRQPVTRATLEAVRGVNCEAVLRTLLSRGLIAEVGRLEHAGRPILYGTTFTFLQQFGLKDLSELPPLDGHDSALTVGPISELE